MTKPSFALDDQFQANGSWWVPSNFDQQAAGILRFGPDGGAVLELWDCPYEWLASNPTTLQGDTDQGGVLLTGLLNTKYGMRSRRTSFGGVSSNTLSFYAHKAFVGEYYDSEDGVDFDTYSLTFQQLPHWLDHSPFEEPMRPVSKVSGTILEYVAPPQVSVEIDSDGMQIAFHYEAVHESRDRFQSAWDFEARIELRAASTQPIEWFEERQRRISILLAMLSGQPVIPSRIVGVKKAEPVIDTTLVNVCYSQAAAPVGERDRMCRATLIPYPLIADTFPEIASNWMELAPSLGAAPEIIYISLIRPLPFTETRFLFMAQALETLHRRLFGGEHMHKADYKKLNPKLREAIDGVLPDELSKDARVAIKARLGFAHEYTLKERFVDLLTRLPESIRTFICDDLEAFAEACKNERNLLTHDPADSPHQPMANRVHAIHCMRWLAVVTLLRHIRVSDEVLVNRLRENFPSEYRFTATKAS